MKISRPEAKPLIIILVKRAVFFFFFLCLLTLFLYGIGSSQLFMDETQLMLLRLATIFGLFLVVGAVYGVILDLWFFLYRRKYRYVRGAAVYAFLLLLGLLIAAAAAFILVVAGGNRL